MNISQTITTTLYEQDFNLWLNETAQQLKNKEFETVDLENLVEEIEAMGRSEKRELSSLFQML